MKIPRFWALGEAEAMGPDGERVTGACFHWSDHSEDDARRLAQARAAEVLARRLSGEQLNRYLYGDRPVREEIVDAVVDRRKKEIALITRNAYGALVLNSAGAMFMDRDFRPENQAGGFGKIKSLFGGAKAGPEKKALGEVAKWAERHPELNLRVYRTRAGLRILVTNHTFDPARPETEALMTELGCDPLYIRLCKIQECFRARLTPKPWRIDMPKPPNRFPFGSPRAERACRDWEREYERASQPFGVCRLIEQFGGSRVLDEVQPILDLHDRWCRASYNLPLA